MNSLPSTQKFTDVASANIQTFQSYANVVMNAAQRLTALNMETARSMFALASTNSVPLLSEGLREQLLNRAAAQNQSMEQAAEYLRSLNEVLLKTQAELGQVSAQRMGESTATLHAMLDTMAKSGPAGTPELVSAFKSALNTASAALEGFLTTTREMTETNLTAAANALQSTVSEAAITSKAARKAA